MSDEEEPSRPTANPASKRSASSSQAKSVKRKARSVEKPGLDNTMSGRTMLDRILEENEDEAKSPQPGTSDTNSKSKKARQLSNDDSPVKTGKPSRSAKRKPPMVEEKDPPLPLGLSHA